MTDFTEKAQNYQLFRLGLNSNGFITENLKSRARVIKTELIMNIQILLVLAVTFTTIKNMLFATIKKTKIPISDFSSNYPQLNASQKNKGCVILTTIK